MAGSTGFGVRVPGYRIQDFVIFSTVLETEFRDLHMLGICSVPEYILSPRILNLTLGSYISSRNFFVVSASLPIK